MPWTPDYRAHGARVSVVTYLQPGQGWRTPMTHQPPSNGARLDLPNRLILIWFGSTHVHVVRVIDKRGPVRPVPIAAIHGIRRHSKFFPLPCVLYSICALCSVFLEPKLFSGPVWDVSIRQLVHMAKKVQSYDHVQTKVIMLSSGCTFSIVQ